jgi:hypothetical protein
MLAAARADGAGWSEMKRDNVLDLEAVNLSDLANALEDHSHEHSWWPDARAERSFCGAGPRSRGSRILTHVT